MSRAKTEQGTKVQVEYTAIVGRQGGKGICGIEDAAEEVARQAKLAAMAERIAAYDRGYEGGRRKCPRCGQWQKYKGDTAREMVFDCGTLRMARAYYVCGACGQSSYPLDETLGLVEGKEQGRLREKLTLLAVLSPYHQAPQVCQTLLGSERHAMTLRRVALREAEHLATSGHHQQLPIREHDRLYLEVDGHHTVEDVGIALGEAFHQALGSKEGITRYGTAYVPMDETLGRTVVDFSGRPYLVCNAEFPSEKVGAMSTELVEEFFRALAVHARVNLHVEVLYGKNSHHMVEAMFKSAARAFCIAVTKDPRVTGIPSTKGVL
jgi:imidazoleglycerol-phosphate dehydratase